MYELPLELCNKEKIYMPQHHKSYFEHHKTKEDLDEDVSKLNPIFLSVKYLLRPECLVALYIHIF